MLGPWWGFGRDEDAVTVRTGVENTLPGATVTYAQGCDADCTSTAGFGAAEDAARAADATILVVGESREMSGEAAEPVGDRAARPPAGARGPDQGDRASRSSWS